ncbi:hypothetical protein C2E23DRAFT_717211 [Lenzites betulinus]|nr:hypothetical protein C2E23DRAFT_717211 [Lenzites betulinus]
MSAIADESPPGRTHDVVEPGAPQAVPDVGPTNHPPEPAITSTLDVDGPAHAPNTGISPGIAAARAHADHTSLPPELWLEIFRYATCVPGTRTIAPADPFIPERPANYAWGMNTATQSMRTKCALVRVSRAWRALATELLYEHVVLGSSRRVQLFCRTLVESQEMERKIMAACGGGSDTPLGHGRWVRHLEVLRWARKIQTAQYWQCLVRSVYMSPKLRVFSGLWQNPLPQGVFPALEQYLPSTLQELYWQQDSVILAAKELPILTTPFLAKFSTLRVLDLRKIRILDAERSLPDVKFVSLTLPHVVYLALPTCPIVLRFASMQDMPALRYFILDADGAPRTVWASWVAKELTNFLEHHGAKLTTVELLPATTQSFRPGPVGISAFLSPTACPNLDTLVGTTGTSMPLLEGAHPRLRRVGIRGTGISRLYPNKPSQAQAHLSVLVGCRALFPALEVVRTLGFLVGTSTDPFAPDVFIWWTERFERVGVDLQDGEGVVWMLEEEKASEKVPEKEATAVLEPANENMGEVAAEAAVDEKVSVEERPDASAKSTLAAQSPRD